MGRARQWASKLDMYRKVPGDLVEGSKQGSVVSWMAIFTIAFLFYKETADYFSSRLVSNLTLDRRQSKDDMIQVTFNITMMDLRCDHISVDVVSVLGNHQNARKRRISGIAVVPLSRLQDWEHRFEWEVSKVLKSESLVSILG